LSQVDALHVQLQDSNLHASARTAVYRGLHIHRADLECRDLKISLGPLALAQGRVLQQETMFQLQVEVVEEGLARSTDSPLLRKILQEWSPDTYEGSEDIETPRNSAQVRLQEGWCEIGRSPTTCGKENTLRFWLDVRGCTQNLLVVTFDDGQELEYSLGDHTRIHALDVSGGKLSCSLELLAIP